MDGFLNTLPGITGIIRGEKNGAGGLIKAIPGITGIICSGTESEAPKYVAVILSGVSAYSAGTVCKEVFSAKKEET